MKPRTSHKTIHEKTTHRMGVLVFFLLSACTQRPQQLARLQSSQIQEPPQTVNLEIKSYCSQQYTPSLFESVFVTNLQTRTLRGMLVADTDGDGIPDITETQNNARLGISPGSRNSILNGISDLVIFLSGILPPSQSRLRCSGSADLTDDDRDGLTLCEERILQTDPTKFDTDEDGIPDSLELRCGTNPLDPSDSRRDTDFDGVSNIEECRRNTPIDFDNSTPSVAQVAYHYSTAREEAPEFSKPCMKFFIENIPVIPEAGTNTLKVYFLEKNSITQKPQISTFSYPITQGMGGRPGATIHCDLDLVVNSNRLEGSCNTR